MFWMWRDSYKKQDNPSNASFYEIEEVVKKTIALTKQKCEKKRVEIVSGYKDGFEHGKQAEQKRILEMIDNWYSEIFQNKEDKSTYKLMISYHDKIRLKKEIMQDDRT